MRGALQFFISIIYGAAIVLIIYWILQAFLGAASLSDDSARQLDRISRAVQAGTTTGVEIKPEESVFIGSSDDRDCEEKLSEIRGVCESGMLCVCFSFGLDEGDSSVCRSIPYHSFTIEAGDDSASHDRCAWSTNPGFFTIGVEGEKIVLRGESPRG